MKIYEHRIKLFLTPDEFSQFFNYYSEGRLLGSAVDLETDLESYFEGVGEEDLKRCFVTVAANECLVLPFHTNTRVELVFDLILLKENIRL